jgi:hypothetical protein
MPSGPLFGGLSPGLLLVLASPSGMDPHRLAEERSVAYHRVIAERLRDQPAILDRARRRVQDWLASGPGAPAAATRWAAVLAGDAASIAAFLVERSEQADELRQSSPFAGALDPRERWRIWRATRDRLAGQP